MTTPASEAALPATAATAASGVSRRAVGSGASTPHASPATSTGPGPSPSTRATAASVVGGRSSWRSGQQKNSEAGPVGAGRPARSRKAAVTAASATSGGNPAGGAETGSALTPGAPPRGDSA